jgi:hypothetical protein
MTRMPDRREPEDWREPKGGGMTNGHFGKGARLLWVVVLAMALLTLAIGIYALSEKPPPSPAPAGSPIESRL